jgi:ribose transport system substrate-binding protein
MPLTPSGRLASLTLAAATATVLLAGCSGAAAPANTAGDLNGRKVTMVVGIANLPFYQNEACAAEKVLSAAGVDFTYQESQDFDTAKQVQLLQSVIASSPDAIMLSPTNGEALAAPVQEAESSDIPVVLFDTNLNDPSVASGDVVTDNLAAGAAGADALTAALAGRAGSIAVVGFPAGNSVTDDREAGFLDAFTPPAGTTLLDVQRIEGLDTSASANTAAAILAANPDLTAMVAVNAAALRGAVQAVKEAGKQDTVTIVGFDIDQSFVPDVQSGLVSAVVGINAVEEGRIAGELTLAALRGEAPQSTTVAPLVMTADNVDQAIDQVYGCSGAGS